jgi:DNA-binding NtrC family response regulator
MGRENFRILIVDDEVSFSLLVWQILRDEGYRVKSAASAEDALKILDGYSPDLVISDIRMPGMDGIAFMNEVKSKYPETAFVMITAFAAVETAVAAMKMGALDYITKPLKEPEELRKLVSKAYEKNELMTENRALREELRGEFPPADILFAGMEKVRDDIRAVAGTETTVMLYGETGTGKSLVAKVIHQLSGKKGLLVTINCASIPENLLESELFGYERGAFTGALQSKKGKFELADNGTIFLDEIAEMSPNLQAKLLRVLQERSFERLGGLETTGTNARVIAATNRNLKELVAGNRFREDLYYRLNVFPVHIPPLRERKEIIPQLTEYLVKRLSVKIGRTITEIPAESMERLMSHQWPGNVRELENLIERAIILSRDEKLSFPFFGQAQEEPVGEDMKSIEKRALENALRKTEGNRKAAAEMLGISLRSLQYKIKEYQIR